MRGLLIKDFFCLKKQLINYTFAIIGVVVISILFVLSYNFGNIHAGILKMLDSGEGTQADVAQLATVALLFCMLTPIACTGDITNLVTDDENASFYKVAAALPISIRKRVACRFITGYLFIAIGVVIDFIMTIVLSSLTDIISFGKFCGAIVSFASIMMICISLFIFFVYFLGKGGAVYASIIPWIIGVVIYVSVNFEKLKGFMLGSNENALLDLYNQATEVIFHKSYVLFIAAIIVSGSAYFAAVYTAGRKRGVA